MNCEFLILNEGIISFKLQALITLLVRLVSYNNQSSFLCFRGCPQKRIKKSPGVDGGLYEVMSDYMGIKTRLALLPEALAAVTHQAQEAGAYQ